MKYRKYVVDSLYKVLTEGKYSNIESVSAMGRMEDKKEKDLYLFTFNGVLENLIFADWVIAEYSSVKLRKINANVLNIMRSAVFQIFFSERISSTRIVNDSVELTKKCLYKSTRFVNGILRNIVRNKEEILIKLDGIGGIEGLSIKYSYPMEFMKLIVEEFGFEEAEKFCIASNSKPETVFRVNSSIISRDEFLKKYGGKYEVKKTDTSNYGIIIRNIHRLQDMDEFKNGLITPQDESSILVSEILNPDKDSRIIDMCCAPGGKCLHSAEIMKNTGKVICCDIYGHKLKLVEETALRLGLENIEIREQDGLELIPEFFESFDYCIVDVPCSNTGIIRRKPEIKYNLRVDGLKEIEEIQYGILENASKYLKKGGRLVYSTCSVLDNENINLVKRFLENNSEFEFKGFEVGGKVVSEGYLQLYPQIDNMDGFFIASLVKN
ncbi:16S rRNA (cytosine967-C5)-methyltransferase [Dethiosulfatibacter aminovorans DSM 17477]|uniref:16S rRNA (cytosine(967)-C(5))-methyltransferase n=1 Tax=Dethiosulfatibacter aminovorans DSM 17477 TaxID=1121476 RepID=A0A1M6DI55_9FIRM|nr:16S rRNA (cytosine(967)-C(5))-methyltransferase RsmB [Dethiosulfatibacter aminovorans]SHI73037.1 16S rRNA (cytosine967-C5)-methyltransferase [Dethiosulfatibacter aminovorans DSM 17477]